MHDPDDRRTIGGLTIEVAGSSFVLRDTQDEAFRFDAGPPSRLTYSVPRRPWEDAAMDLLLGVVPLTLPAFDLVPMHGAAVTPDGRTACLVLGDSGAGKSTTLAALLDAGAWFLADDACAIDEEGLLWPGPPLYSTRDSASDGDLPTFGGKGVHRPGREWSSPIPVGSIAVLSPGPLSARVVDGGAAVRHIMDHHRSKWLLAAGRERLRFGVTTKMASIPVKEINYTPGVDTPSRVAELILA